MIITIRVKYPEVRYILALVPENHARLFANYSGPSCYLKYKASNKRLKRVSRYATVSGTYKATKSFKTSSRATTVNSGGVTVKKGN